MVILNFVKIKPINFVVGDDVTENTVCPKIIEDVEKNIRILLGPTTFAFLKIVK